MNRSSASSTNSPAHDWDWESKPRSMSEASVESKSSTTRRVKEKQTKEESLMNFEKESSGTGYNSKLEEDAWEILKD